MEIKFTATESVDIKVEEAEIPIKHYLRQPQRLVGAIANADLTEQLSEERFRVKMRSLDFMGMYHFQPTVVLKVSANANGKINLESESSEIRGIEYINQRFVLYVTGQLAPYSTKVGTYLTGKADLEVKVELPPPLWLTPKPVLEGAGNRLLKSVLLRIKNKIVNHLVQDYYQWSRLTDSSEEEKSKVMKANLKTENC